MLGVFIHLILLMQGIPLLPNQGGTVTGVLMTADSGPAVGVRVAVMAQPEPGDVAGASALVSIAESDDAGRFRLENVPPGRYYITAGRVEQPTFYPGTLEMTSGKIVTVASGETLSGVNFSIKDVSDRSVSTINAALRIPLQIRSETGVRIPIFSERGKARLKLTHVSDGVYADFILDSPAVSLPIASGEYQVSVENLPDDLILNSLTFGTTNLLANKLKITMNDLPE
ncbi:MAG TPA: carboxypeptidase-like regulatory domain-containing protein, partial [Terriglobia bacterium]|nr:carboxypeptidase-like regulatory domain-containing protein [Terriglobia bacterium]